MGTKSTISVRILVFIWLASAVRVEAQVWTNSKEAENFQKLVASGKSEQAIKQLRAFVAKSPEDADARLLLSSILIAKGTPPGCAPIVACAKAWLGAELSIPKEDLSEATEHAQAAVRLAPHNADAASLLGLSLARAGKLEEGAKQLRRALEIEPETAGTHLQLGWIFNRARQPDAAIPELSKALELDPKDGLAWLELGYSYHLKNDLGKSIEASRKSIELNGGSEGAYRNLCAIYTDRNEYEQLVESCEAVVRLSPNDARTWNILAWSYATAVDARFKNPARALAYAQKAVSLTGEKNAGILDTLAEAYYVNANYDRAIATEKKALALDPANESFKKSIERYQQAKQSKR